MTDTKVGGDILAPVVSDDELHQLVLALCQQRTMVRRRLPPYIQLPETVRRKPLNIAGPGYSD